PGPSLERIQLLAPGRQALRVPRNLLGIDAVRLDARPGVRLVVAGSLEGGFEIADLDLEPLPGPRLFRDRPERLERVRLLLDLERCRVAVRRQRVGRFLADEAVELGGEPL